MAKMVFFLPDDLLRAIDAEAARRGATRSGLLRSFADDAVRTGSAERAARIEELMREPVSHGGDVAERLKLHRPRR